MEIILYITGGVALLAMAWLFISIAKSVAEIKPYLDAVRGDLAQMVTAVNEVKAEVLPILGNVNQITSHVSEITGNVEKQLIHVHETIDDALDIIECTTHDVERVVDRLMHVDELLLHVAGNFRNVGRNLVDIPENRENLCLDLVHGRDHLCEIPANCVKVRLDFRYTLRNRDE